MTVVLAGFGRENQSQGERRLVFFFIEIGEILGLFVCLSFKKFGWPGNILNFNVGASVDLDIPRGFWSHLAGKYGNMFYWKEKVNYKVAGIFS